MARQSGVDKEIIRYLKDNPGVQFTFSEIADGLRDREIQVEPKYVNVVLRFKPTKAVLAEGDKVVIVEGYPLKSYWTDKGDEDVAVSESSDTVDVGQLPAEKDLYPLLAEFLWSGFARPIYAKRINEAKSSNKHGPEGNKWLYPDLVGMEDLTSDWGTEIQALVEVHSDKKAKLWSFEVKKFLKRSDARRFFFQALSNSSWANFAYLVAAEIHGTDTMRELRMLSALHGIGLIKLDIKNPVESQILIPAQERGDVDWDSCNRLAVENPDYREFVDAVKAFLTAKDKKHLNMDVWNLPENWKEVG